MKKNLMILCVLALVSAWAVEVPIFDGERAAFLKMTPAERRERFTDAAWRAKLGKGYQKIKWREAVNGEVSRWCRVDGAVNCRDVGGFKGLNGRMVKMGMVFRSGQFNKAAPFHLVTNDSKKVVREYYGGCEATMTAAQVEAARKRLGVKTDLDLRGTDQCLGMKMSPLGEGVKFVNTPSYNYAGVFESPGDKIMADSLRVFLDKDNYPIVFHCVKGADRTGTLAFILQSVLGVSAEDRLLDWELTAFSNPNPKFEHKKRYDRMVAELAKFPGSSDAEKAAAYMKKLGFTDADIEFLRAHLLENSK